MAISRILVAQDQEDCQVLNTDNRQRYIVNYESNWQLLFGPGSELSSSTQVLKISAELDTENFQKIRLIGYLYNPITGGIDGAGNCEFRIHRVVKTTNPNWSDVFITSIAGTLQSNGYYFAEVNISDITGANLDGDTTLMIEAFSDRLSTKYRERVYINHLGVYDSIVRLRQDVEFLDITKKDE